MSLVNEIVFLKSQLLDVQRLLKLTAEHPLMGKAFACREDEFRKRISRVEDYDNQDSCGSSTTTRFPMPSPTLDDPKKSAAFSLVSNDTCMVRRNDFQIPQAGQAMSLNILHSTTL